MAEYIDRKTVVDIIQTAGFWETEDMEVAITCVEQTPTVDAVPVVRCTDCWFYQDDCSCGWNGSTGWAPDDYCSYGERMADAKIGGAGL